MANDNAKQPILLEITNVGHHYFATLSGDGINGSIKLNEQDLQQLSEKAGVLAGKLQRIKELLAKNQHNIK